MYNPQMRVILPE